MMNTLLRFVALVGAVAATPIGKDYSKLAGVSPDAHTVPRSHFPAAGDQTMAPLAFKPLKNGAITPKGWLLKQLKLQAEGLSGHLSMFWNDIENSIWLPGGKGDGGLHERAPYWLNGIVPLASLLQNAGEELLHGTAGIYKTQSLKDGYVDAV